MGDLTDRIAKVVEANICGNLDWSYAQVAAAVVEDLKLEEEIHPSAPVWEPVYDEEGNPVMEEKWVQPVQKNRLMWVTKRRWATPYEEIGERITSEALQARIESSK